MMLICDNVLYEEERLLCLSSADKRKTNWIDLTINQITEDRVENKLLKMASKIFDLTNMVGIETWIHNNTKPGWHYDKDEFLFNQVGRLVFPICSIVYYIQVENLQNGKFITHNEVITPITNRALFFSPGIHHCAEDFTGTRILLAIAPWQYKIRI